MKKIYAFMAAVIVTFSLSAASASFVTNGTFEEEDTDGWYQIQNEGTHSFTKDPVSPMQGSNSALITILTSTTNETIADAWKQGVSWRMSTTKNASYKIHFKARASKELQLVTEFQQNFSPYVVFGYKEWTITTDPQVFELVVNNDKNVGGDWKFNFLYGHLNVGDKVWIDDVQIEEVANESTGLFSDLNLCNGDFEQDVANSGDALISGGWRTFTADPARMTFALDSSSPISGTRSFKGTSVVQGSAGWNAQIIWNFCPVVGQIYTIEFKAKANADMPIVVEAIDDWTENRNNSMAYLTYNVTSTVNTFTGDCSVEATEYDLYTFIFWLGNLPAGKSIWLDDIKIHQKDLSTGLKMAFDEDANVSVLTRGNGVIVNTPMSAVINLFNMKGQRVASQRAVAGENIITCNEGLYVVQVINSNRIIKSVKVKL